MLFLITQRLLISVNSNRLKELELQLPLPVIMKVLHNTWKYRKKEKKKIEWLSYFYPKNPASWQQNFYFISIFVYQKSINKPGLHSNF